MSNNATERNMFLSDQAMGAVMMALQRSLLEQSDIVPVLREMKFRLSEQGLIVLNPPVVRAPTTGVETTETDTTSTQSVE